MVIGYNKDKNYQRTIKKLLGCITRNLIVLYVAEESVWMTTVCIRMKCCVTHSRPLPVLSDLTSEPEPSFVTIWRRGGSG